VPTATSSGDAGVQGVALRDLTAVSVAETPRRVELTPTTEESVFGVLLRRSRVAAGLSQEALAERASLSVRGISDLERGARRAPHLATVGSLGQALGLAERELQLLFTAARKTDRSTIARRHDRSARECGTPTSPARAAERQGPALLPSKLALPIPRSRRAHRPGLVNQLSSADDRRLILLSAAAGFGKTTLLAEWLSSQPKVHDSVAWLTLDAGDNDAARFWMYVFAALRRVRPDLPQPAGASQHDAIPAELARQLALGSAPILLVLDDYHHIESSTIHAGVTFLIEHLPAHVRVVVGTRIDPPFPLARLRARGLLLELRANDLRFTLTEAAAFLNDAMDLALTPDMVATLEARTEGWIAGLHLAALSLQGCRDAETFVSAFGGSNRFVLDYLLEEIVHRQPERIQRFLIRTSILEQLSGPLCEAVAGDTDGQALLEFLERANMFVVPLDEQRTWYRYHHLFAEALRHRLLRESPESVAELHRRASSWYRANELPQEAEVFLARLELTRARLLRARGDLVGAEAALSQAEAAAQGMRNVLQGQWIQAERAGLHLLQGDPASAAA
jgi:transcriptional regulator with XRE-family HTH domain